MTANRHGVKPGDVFVCSWGYDQTNVNYYLVTRVTAARAEVVPIGCTVTLETGTSYEEVVPNPGHVRGSDVLTGVGIEGWDGRPAPKSKLCATKTSDYEDGRPYIVLRSGRYTASRWEGRPQYATASGWGR